MNTAPTAKPRAPVSDAIIIAVSELVDDAQSERREPSHMTSSLKSTEPG
jgi:hypothetical protein